MLGCKSIHTYITGVAFGAIRSWVVGRLMELSIVYPVQARHHAIVLLLQLSGQLRPHDDLKKMQKWLYVVCSALGDDLFSVMRVVSGSGACDDSLRFQAGIPPFVLSVTTRSMHPHFPAPQTAPASPRTCRRGRCGVVLCVRRPLVSRHHPSSLG